MKRIVLYLATNFAIVLMLSFVARLLGLDQWMTQRGMQMGPLLAMAALMGFGGSFISLAMSKWIAKRTMGLTVIGDPRTEEERWLVETVRRFAEKNLRNVYREAEESKHVPQNVVQMGWERLVPPGHGDWVMVPSVLKTTAEPPQPG